MDEVKDVVALLTWLMAAFGGFYLLGTWISHGGLRGASRLPRPAVFVHFLLAASGLVAWVAYLATDTSEYAWDAFILLLPAAVLGLIMFALWMPSAASSATGRDTSRGTHGMRAATAERHFPFSVVLAHGTFAIITLLLVLYTALHNRS